MATAVLQRAKIPGPGPSASPLPVSSKARRPDESPEASSSRYPQPTIAVDVFGSPSTPEPPSRSFHKFRVSLEQSLRTATRSKKLPASPVDEFDTVTGNTKKGKEKETQRTEDVASKEKGRLKMFRKVTFRRTDRDSPPPPPVYDESRRGKDRVAGYASYITPSMRQASMSSPALHLSSQALPSPKSQSAINASSSSNTDGLVSPTRQRTRRVSLQPSNVTREISGPSALSAKLDPKPGPTPSTHHRSAKSTPIFIPPSPSSPALENHNVYASRGSPSPARARGSSLSPHDSPSYRPLAIRIPSNTGSPVPCTSSPSTPTRVRSPSSNREHVVSPSKGTTSVSTSNPSPTPRRPSIDSPRRLALESPRRALGETPRRPSADAGNRSRQSPNPFRADSPLSSPVSPRSRTPSQRAYAQNRHYNISAGSLLLPIANPEHRELIRTATTMLCKEIIKAPPHMMKSEQGIRDWEEVEYRTRSLARLERIWGRSGATNGSPVVSPYILSAGEERERRSFCEALRDGFVLCQLLNKLRASTVVRPDPKEDGFTKTSNITKFLAACASYGLAYEEMFQRDDLIEGTTESLARVAQTIIALIQFVESPVPSRSKYMSGQNKPMNSGTWSPYGTLSGISASTPNLVPPSPISPDRKRWSPTTELHTGRPYSPEDMVTQSLTTIRQTKSPNAKIAEADGNELEVKPMTVPVIGKKPPPPPKSPLRKKSSRSQDPGGLFSWAKNAASPIASSPSSPQVREATFRDPVRHSRQSMASSVITSTTLLSTAPSSLLDAGHGNSGNNYGTIRTVTTDMTSEAPSITRTEGASIAEATWRTSIDAPRSPSKFRDRKSGELHNVDLSRVAEETDDSGKSKGSREAKESNRNLSPNHAIGKPTIHLRKGRWPDDFLDAFEKYKPHRSISPRTSPPETDGALSSASPISISSPRKLAVIGVSHSNEEGLSHSPRRPAHRPRHSIDRPGLLPKESLLRRDTSPDSSTPLTGPILRRHSAKPFVLHGGSFVSRNSDEIRGAEDGPVPFPSGEEAKGATSPSSSSEGDTAVVEERPRLRGRFQSDVESSSARARGSQEDMGARTTRTRFESMVNLRASSSNGASASDLLSRNSMDSGSAKSLVVRENGKPPVHFQLGNCIGRGQFGSVYRALNLNTGQMVAVKRIRLEGLKEEEVTQLMREVDLVKNLSHPSIVKYEGMGRDEDHLSIVLEYAENGSLAQTLKAFGKLNERLVASYVVKILEGLHYLHTSHVVHCDLKAANILTTKNGNVKLSDFGVSLNLRAMEREIKDVAGTPNWMAPEVIELKGPSTKSDIWSLGCTVVELLTGRPPYAEIANSMSVMFRIVEDKVPPLPESCSDLLQGFLKQCFQKNPTARPSAEMLCEHAWLKANWRELKDLRPQDSIPFLRRVSADLQKTDVRYFSQMDISESPVSERYVRGDASKLGRRTSNASVRHLPDNDISPREHSFVKTTFSKPMMCRVCLLNVKKSAVLCAQCSLISHAKCALSAPPTCDLRAQLLLYAQYAEKGSPGSVHSNPVDLSGEAKRPGAMSDVPYVSHSTSGRMDTDTPPTPSFVPSQSSDSPPTAYRFISAFKRSRSNLTPEPQARPTSATPQSQEPEDYVRPRRATLLQKRTERPLSATSDSTGVSSLRSAATAAESMSSRHRSQQSSGGRGPKATRLPGGLLATTESEVTHVAPQLPSELSTDNSTRHDTAKAPPNSSSPDSRRHKRNARSAGNCIMQ